RLDRSNFTSPRQIPEDLREQIVDRFCKADVRDLSLTQAFYKLLDKNKEYWCSLSTLYRLFRAHPAQTLDEALLKCVFLSQS
ncbi:hypothetical protein, partial [Sutterella seckii]|uniref:hypothetical protein n=1 Tax=Sutterella seckii TaxID=1944635 RepID=UPI001D054C2A